MFRHYYFWYSSCITPAFDDTIFQYPYVSTPYVATPHCVDTPLFRHLYASTSLFIDTLMFRHPSVTTRHPGILSSICSKPVFSTTLYFLCPYVLIVSSLICSAILFSWHFTYSITMENILCMKNSIFSYARRLYCGFLWRNSEASEHDGSRDTG